VISVPFSLSKSSVQFSFYCFNELALKLAFSLKQHLFICFSFLPLVLTLHVKDHLLFHTLEQVSSLLQVCRRVLLVTHPELI